MEARAFDINATAQDLAMNVAMKNPGQKRDHNFFAPAQTIGADAKTAKVQPTAEAVQRSQQDARLEKAGVSKKTLENIANRANRARNMSRYQMTRALGAPRAETVSANSGENSRYIAGRGWSRRQFNPKRNDIALDPTKMQEAPLEKSMLDKTIDKMAEQGMSFMTGPKPSSTSELEKMLRFGKSASMFSKVIGSALNLAEAADPALMALEAVSGAIRHDPVRRRAPGMSPMPA